MIPGSAPIIAGARYQAKAVKFNGSPDYLSRSSALSGVSDSADGTISFWVRKDAGDGSQQDIFEFYNGSTLCLMALIDASGKYGFVGVAPSGTIRFSFTSTATLLAGATWHHCVTSWRCASGGGVKFYLDGTLDTSDTVSNGNVDLTVSTMRIARSGVGSDYATVSLAEIWFDPTFIDLSIAANVQKFRTAAGKPAALGADGSAPTGAQPAIYLRGPVSGIATNFGYGGNFTVNGSPTDTTPGPSD